ncbi:hypothetical protein CF485_17780 [Salmonella enterica subsp. enterica serovar Schwarzengrund]|nr:hypothetical protein [Salmonella enterica subsp. enterica serovar Schwarzengrund]ECT9241126.1 hypothetical protein [Salmonella enterica subsp. enterica serovar Schwarzengrund]
MVATIYGSSQAQLSERLSLMCTCDARKWYYQDASYAAFINLSDSSPTEQAIAIFCSLLNDGHR